MYSLRVLTSSNFAFNVIITGAGGGKRKLGDMMVKEHGEGGEVVDLLDASMVRHLRLNDGNRNKAGRRRKRDEDDDGMSDNDDSSSGEDDGAEVEFNAQGKLVIKESGGGKEKEEQKVKARLMEIDREMKEDEDEDGGDLIRTGPKRKKMKRADGSAGGKGGNKGKRKGPQVRSV